MDYQAQTGGWIDALVVAKAGCGPGRRVAHDLSRIWAKHGLQPHRLEGYVCSNDPDFESKAADVIGLYLNPLAHATVFCMDEKSAIQPLDRKDPVLPRAFALMPPSTPRRARYWARPRLATPAPSSWHF